MSTRIEALLNMLEQGQDSALLRFAIGNEYLLAGEPDAAMVHLQKATEHDNSYSAAWKLLGKACADAGKTSAAKAAFTAGIEAANAQGDRQAAKEMTVFLKRLRASNETST
ncbi:MAG: hypothetical protein HKN35_01760 [Woeseia sp.]|nr:hypothetical protein [Woeseia sp.]MBT8097518.1 hypothetical protein [Woeseia sp.]NNE59602.1 hypothetical protein [Woeseia sp.]NNL55215.1 hypothetical protein [Woeseia sp.]